MNDSTKGSDLLEELKQAIRVKREGVNNINKGDSN